MTTKLVLMVVLAAGAFRLAVLEVAPALTADPVEVTQ